MKHDFIDKYAYLESPVHRLDARVKLISAAVFILGIALTSKGVYLDYAWAAIFVLVITLLSRVPLKYVITRSMVVIPFVALAGAFLLVNAKDISTGLHILLPVFLKAALCASTAVLLTSVTPMPKLLKGMESLGAPRLLTTVTSFLYRYFFVMVDEFERMNRARISRSVSGSFRNTVRGYSNVLASGLLRSFERSERTYLAMLSRGFDGTMKTLDENGGSKVLDFVICFSFIALIVFLKAARWMLG